MTEPTLKPCPFCGQPPEMFLNRASWVVGCAHTGCEAHPSVVAPTEQQAADAWNTRPLALDLVQHLRRQMIFSRETFGPGARTAGVVDHIRKELQEVEGSGGALAEWVDVIILGLDGAWRSGASPEQVVGALLAKQATNERRQWPDWRTAPADRAIEHVRGEVAA